MGEHFQNKSAFYGEGRKGYAEEAIRRIAEVVAAPPAAIADMGSGTGILAASLLEKGYRVYCVEPDAALRQAAEERLRGFEGFSAVAASAEETGLPDRSVEGIVAASAFHWFDAEAFLRECRRIIRPGGQVFLLYNVRQTGDSFSREQERICRQYCPKFTGLHHGVDKARERLGTFFSRGCEEESYPHDLTYTEERLLSRCLSSSYSPSPSEAGHLAYRQALEALIAAHSEDGPITIRNHTLLWHGEIE